MTAPHPESERRVEGPARLPSLHVNISTLFREVEPWERPAAAARHGFQGIECWWPFDGPRPPPADRARFVRAIRDAGVELVAMNLDAGDLAAGERGLLSDPERTEHFQRSLDAGIDLAGELGCRVVHALCGNRRLGVDPREQDELAIEQLGKAAAAARTIGAKVVVEALNPWENPLYPLHRTDDVLQLMDRVSVETGEQVWCLYDLYHVHRAEGELIATIQRHAGRFGHVHLADAPGRGEPGTGEIAFPRVLAALRDSGYHGGVGVEYLPTVSSEASLAGMDALRAVLTGDGGPT